MINSRIDVNENKVYITSNSEFDKESKIIFSNKNDVIYETYLKFIANIEFWMSPQNMFKYHSVILVKIYDNDKIIHENSFIIRNNSEVKKPLVYIIGCFGDVLYTTSILRLIYKAYQHKVYLSTSSPEIFINNPYVEIIDINTINIQDYEVFNLNEGISSGNNIIKHIRKMHLIDFFSMNIGAILTPEEKQIDFFPDVYDNKFNLPDDYICINPSKTWNSRTWSTDNWNKLIKMLEMINIKVVMLGKDINYLQYNNDNKGFVEIKNENIIDLTNQTSLSDAHYIINKSKVFITMDSGLLVLAGATDTNIIQIGSSINPYYRAPYRNGSQHYKYCHIPGECKLFCASDLKYSLNICRNLSNFPIATDCLENYESFKCHPTPNQVFKKIINYV